MALIERFSISRDIRIILLAAIYSLGSWIGYQLSFTMPLNIPIWPSAGLGLAFLIILGKDSWPGISIGALITQIFFFWNTGVLSPHYIIAHPTPPVKGSCLPAIIGTPRY